MDNKLWKEAIETKYDVVNDKTTESLKDVAVIGASLKNPSYGDCNDFGDSDSFICFIIADRMYKGKKCPKDCVLVFEILYFTNFMKDKTEYDKLILICNDKRFEYRAKSVVTAVDSKGYWEYTAGWLKSKRIINGLSDGDKQLNGRNSKYLRQIRTICTPEEVLQISNLKTKVSLCVDKDTKINVKGGDIKFAKSDGSFHIEGLSGFMKRVYHFFVDETSYTDYCTSYYENKKKLAKEAKKRAIKLRNIWLVVLIVSIVFFVLSLSLDWEDTTVMILSFILGIISIFKVGDLQDWW